jgi:tetratricopeptide (TPR) repeat protein
MHISATLITGNSCDTIADAIQSALPLVDSILLIDTGITDNTLSIAKEIAGDKLHVKQFSWCNHFASVRNYALYQAATLGAGIAATLDSDERFLCNHETVRAQLETEYVSKPGTFVWMMASACGTYSKERFFRLPIPQRMHWKGQTHECFIGYNTSEFQRIESGQFTEVPKTPEQLLHKYHRDLQVLTETCATDPNDERWWYYLGQTHNALGNADQAIEAYRKAMEIPTGSRPQRACAAYCAATIAFGQKQYELGVELCSRGLAMDANWPELYWLAGLFCYHLQRYQDAIAWCDASIALGHFKGSRRGQDRFLFRFLPGWFETPFEVLRFVYRAIGEDIKADLAEGEYVLAKAARERQFGLDGSR